MIRPRAGLGESFTLAAGAIAAFGFAATTQLDLAPGSTGCPSGCEEDSGWGAVGIFAIGFLPMATGFLVGKLLLRRPLMRAGQ